MSNLISVNTLDHHVPLFAEAGGCKPPPRHLEPPNFLWPGLTRHDKLNNAGNKGRYQPALHP
ncbi:MAG: hypothetical protein WBQ69_01235 [Gallionella sp.]